MGYESVGAVVRCRHKYYVLFNQLLKHASVVMFSDDRDITACCVSLYKDCCK